MSPLLIALGKPILGLFVVGGAFVTPFVYKKAEVARDFELRAAERAQELQQLEENLRDAPRPNEPERPPRIEEAPVEP